jgi:hypothetical protein
MDENYELLFHELHLDFDERLPYTAEILQSIHEFRSAQMACYAAFILIYVTPQTESSDRPPLSELSQVYLSDFAYFPVARQDIHALALLDDLLACFQIEIESKQLFMQ